MAAEDGPALCAESADLIRRAREWQNANGMRKPTEFRELIFPLLADVPIRELARRTGVSLAYCRQIKRGEAVPHPRWWAVLLSPTSQATLEAAQRAPLEGLGSRDQTGGMLRA